jgi:hypothetical protein
MAAGAVGPFASVPAAATTPLAPAPISVAVVLAPMAAVMRIDDRAFRDRYGLD